MKLALSLTLSRLLASPRSSHEDNFLSQVIDSPTRGDVILDLLVTDASELISVRIGGSLGCSDHALVEFTVLRDMGQAKSKVRTLTFRKKLSSLQGISQ